MGRQVGVQKVQVSLLDGKVEITPKSNGGIDPIQLLKATYDSGVSVAEMSMVARGQVTKNASGEFVFQTQSSQSFVITRNDLLSQLETMSDSGKYVTVKGFLYQKQKGQKKQTVPTSLTLTIVEF